MAEEKQNAGLSLEPPEEEKVKEEEQEKSFKRELMDDFLSWLKKVPKGLGKILWSIFTYGWIDKIRAMFISKEHVLEKWNVLIDGGEEKAEEVFKDTESFIKKSEAPSLVLERKEMMPGLIKGILGEKRDFLVVRNEARRLKSYQIFICARNYGNNLDVSWYLTFRMSFLKSMLNLIPFYSLIPATLEDLDLFDLQDLTAYVATCHHSTLEAVEKQMRSLDQDPSKIDRKTKGFLGIS